MTAKAVRNPKFRAVDSSGASLSGGLLYTYEPGTTTNKTTYSDPDLSVANANPIVLDSKGECELFYEGLCRLRVTDADGVLVQNDDDVASDPASGEVWINSLTATYVSASSFTLSGDQTTEYHVGRRVRLTDSSTLYGTITASSYSSPNTTVTVTLDSGSLSASLTTAATSIIPYTPNILPELSTVDIDNININGNTISSTNTNGDINLSPNGTGTVVVNTDMDVDNININGNTISSTNTDGNIVLSPNGTGAIDVSSSQIKSVTAGTASTDAATIGGTETFSNKTYFGAYAGGTIDNTVIGGTTPAAGVFTTLDSGSFSIGGVSVTSTAADLNKTTEITDQSVALDGDFTAGTLHISRAGNIVHLTAQSTSFLSASTVTSATGLVPSGLRPAVTAYNVYFMDATELAWCLVATDGTLTLQFRDWAGSGSARTTGLNPNITYRIA